VTGPDGLLRVGAAVAAPLAAEPGLERVLLARAAEHLPAHEVPRALLATEALPTTPSGKLDRAEVLRRLAGRLGGAAA
jgi:acyl-coenzyme A synthetase/AMP-(fatty) acid ligase